MYRRILTCSILALFMVNLSFGKDQILSEKEKSWLGKAYRYDKEGWII